MHEPTDASARTGMPAPRFAGAPCEAQAVREEPEVGVLRLWPRPQAWVRDPAGWLPSEDWVRLDPPAADRPRQRRWIRWRPAAHGLADEVVPPDVLRTARNFHPSSQFAVLRLLDALREAAPLLEMDPALGALVAAAVPQELPAAYEEVRSLLDQRRTRLLAWLRVPPRRWIVRLLRRLDARAIGIEPLRTLTSLLQTSRSPEVESLLKHIRPMPWWMLEVVCDSLARAAVSPSLLMEASSLDLETVRQRIGAPPGDLDHNPLCDVLSTVTWAALHEGRLVPRSRTLEGLGRLCRDRLEQPPHPWRAEEYEPFPLPPAGDCTLTTFPPVRLRPLRDAAELLTHGRRQDNCIVQNSRYPEEAGTGRAVLFEVGWDSPGGETLATLMISFGRRGWTVHQLLGPTNLSVPPWLADAVSDWVVSLPAPAGAKRRTGQRSPPATPSFQQIGLPLRGA